MSIGARLVPVKLQLKMFPASQGTLIISSIPAKIFSGDACDA